MSLFTLARPEIASHRKASAPDRQTYQTAGAPFVDARDFALPVLPE